jgi:L-lactate dehydrogenase complex protein LldG
MTNPVLDEIRRALGRTPASPISSPPSIYPPRQPGPEEAEIDRLLAEIRLLSGEAQTLPAAGIPAALQDLVARHSVKTATLWETDLIKQLNVAACLQELGVDLIPAQAGKHALAKCDLGVTEADFALPETGTLALLSADEKPRSVSLLPRLHLAVLTPSALRADLHQVFNEAKHNPYLVFISGPSRTSDIELTVALGVHGPKDLAVWVIRE